MTKNFNSTQSTSDKPTADVSLKNYKFSWIALENSFRFDRKQNFDDFSFSLSNLPDKTVKMAGRISSVFLLIGAMFLAVSVQGIKHFKFTFYFSKVASFLCIQVKLLAK